MKPPFWTESIDRYEQSQKLENPCVCSLCGCTTLYALQGMRYYASPARAPWYIGGKIFTSILREWRFEMWRSNWHPLAGPNLVCDSRRLCVSLSRGVRSTLLRTQCWHWNSSTVNYTLPTPVIESTPFLSATEISYTVTCTVVYTRCWIHENKTHTGWLSHLDKTWRHPLGGKLWDGNVSVNTTHSNSEQVCFVLFFLLPNCSYNFPPLAAHCAMVTDQIGTICGAPHRASTHGRQMMYLDVVMLYS